MIMLVVVVGVWCGLVVSIANGFVIHPLSRHSIPPPTTEDYTLTLHHATTKDDNSVFENLVNLPENTVTERTQFVLSPKQVSVRYRQGGGQQQQQGQRKLWRRFPLPSLRRYRKAYQEATLTYTYEYDKLCLEPQQSLNPQSSSSSPIETIGVILIHPIGVGISKWFYERLLNALVNVTTATTRPSSKRFIIFSPDLLGSGSACDPQVEFISSSSSEDEGGRGTGRRSCWTPHMKHLPLLNISDWTDQLIDLMVQSEQPRQGDDHDVTIDRWCLIANGGCSPIALQVAERSIKSWSSSSVGTMTTTSSSLQHPVSNVIISSSPRLGFFLNSTTDPTKVSRAYNRLCGIIGRLFWWYACRNQGTFIQTFSERNLVADPTNLGETWRMNCYQTAIARGGKSRYSTFAFLAGTLQDGCTTSLSVLKNQTSVHIDVIRGRDTRRNQARSWFWQKKKTERKRRQQRNEETTSTIRRLDEEPEKVYMTFREYVQQNGNGGREAVIGGRISLAHEDAVGYAESMLHFLDDPTGTPP